MAVFPVKRILSGGKGTPLCYPVFSAVQSLPDAGISGKASSVSPGWECCVW